nr:hypothetical protein [Tanacetum cinerariifolium]
MVQAVVLTSLSFQKASVDKVPVLRVQHQTGAPQGEELGLMKPLSKALADVQTIPSSQTEPVDTVLELRGRLLELSRYEILLVEPEEGPTSPRETLQENLRRL